MSRSEVLQREPALAISKRATAAKAGQRLVVCCRRLYPHQLIQRFASRAVEVRLFRLRRETGMRINKRVEAQPIA
jgi:hypothetical protein